MEYSKLLDLASDLGHELAMSGAETFRVEESITRVLKAYDIDAEVFFIPNCMHISIEPVIGRPLTRMRRIGLHGNDLDAVEKFSSLSRRICAERPAPEIAVKWLEETRQQQKKYSLPLNMVGHFLAACGFCILFGGTVLDGLLAGVCGLVVGLVNLITAKWNANQFFCTITAAFAMSLLAYAFGALGITANADCVIIGTLMLLVPGLLFTNAMRDIIFGDTNSGINRIIQVLLIALAIALGTAAAWNTTVLWSVPAEGTAIQHSILIQCIACAIGCVGFSIIFNIHGPGMFLCILGGILSWLTYQISLHLGTSDVMAYFYAGLISAAYSETMARIRKYPAISYLVVAIFPLIPGAGVYYTMNHAVQGRMDQFAQQGMHTAAIAGIIAVGILMVSTTVRITTTLRKRNT